MDTSVVRQCPGMFSVFLLTLFIKQIHCPLGTYKHKAFDYFDSEGYFFHHYLFFGFRPFAQHIVHLIYNSTSCS